jgi:hypothetical protein
MSEVQVNQLFLSRPMSERQAMHVGDIQAAATHLLELIGQLDASREKSIAITELQTAVMYATRATALSGGF